MHDHKIHSANKQINYITNIGMVANLILGVLKVIVGLLGGSMALLADGIHSISDIATDITVLLGVYLGSKKPDEQHPYGHGRIETFAAFVIGIVLAVVGAGMIYRAVFDIAAGHIIEPGFEILIVALASVGVKEILYHTTKRIAVRWHSATLYANAWHHRSDALSSIAVIVGFIALQFGFTYGDQAAAIAVGFMIILVGAGIIRGCLYEFTEAAVDSQTSEHIKQIIDSKPSIRRWHRLRTRTMGRQLFVDLHILVDPGLNIASAHEISSNLEESLRSEISRPVNITVHVEPDIPEMRTNTE